MDEAYISDYGEHFHTSDPDDDDDDCDGHRNVSTIRIPNVADSPRRLHQFLKPSFICQKCGNKFSMHLFFQSSLLLNKVVSVYVYSVNDLFMHM
jgi:hypothetical protein